MEKFGCFAKSITIITCLALLSSCASTKEGRTTQAEGTALGAVGGAALGALIGYASGGAEGAIAGAAAGGAVGGTAGFAYGTHVAHQKQKYATTEAWLDGCIASAQQANDRAYAYNRTLNQKIASLEARSKTAIANKDKAAAHQIHKEIAALSAQAADEQKAVNNEIEAQKGASNDPSAHSASNYGAYSKQMDTLRQTSAGLSRNVGRLASLDNQVNL